MNDYRYIRADINKDVIDHINTIESSLITSLNIDIANAFYIVRMLDRDRCHSLLVDCVLSKYCTSIYDKYIYPLYFYYEFCNYLTLSFFANDRGVSVEYAQKMVNSGRAIHNTINNIQPKK